MTSSLPPALFACPCSDLTAAPVPTSSKRASIQPNSFEFKEDQALDSHTLRASHALYPLDHLLYCDECDEIRCPRCWTEEILYWYCPNCLFDVPSSAVRGDGNRCSRSCYGCPSCTSPLHVTQISQRDEAHLRPSDASGGEETYVLQCQYCDWSSLDIDVKFSKPTKITEQLAKQRRTRSNVSTITDPRDKPAQPSDDPFSSLASFYKDQMNDLGESQSAHANSPYNSPANLARIMSLYGGLSYNALKKTREKPQPMREALGLSEGFTVIGDDSKDLKIVDRMQTSGWEATNTNAQQLSTPANHDASFVDELWPAAISLRTRRARRCKTCRHIIARPDPKVGSMRYKIRLLAMNYIPKLTVRPLSSTTPLPNPAFRLRGDAPQLERLQPHKLQQFVLTVRNPLFENVRIALASPSTTPGKVASRVTILCPSFTVGPAGEVWDEALSSSTQSAPDGGRQAAMASLTGSSESSDRQPEAGKIWEKTRNSTSVIVEVVPGSLQPPASIVPRKENELADLELAEDDDILEIPVYVRAEWESEFKPGESVQAKRDANVAPGEKVSKEVSFWVVLNVGRVAA